MNTKDNQILIMLRENKSYSSIQNELCVSPSRIAGIKKKYFTTTTDTTNISANKHVASVFKDFGEWQRLLINKQNYLHEQDLILERKKDVIHQKHENMLNYKESIMHEGLELVKKDIEIKNCKKIIQNLENENDQLKITLKQLEKKLREKTEISLNQTPPSTSFIEKIPEYLQPIVGKVIMKFLDIKDEGFSKKDKIKLRSAGLKDLSPKMSFFKRFRRWFINKIF